MGTAKIILAANSPGALHRLQETLSGLEVHVAIRLRDVVKAAKEGEFALLVFCLGFDERSAVELLQWLRDEHGVTRLPVACIACDETQPASREMEARLREAGACEFLELRHYPPGVKSDAVLRRRLLACVRVGSANASREKLGRPPSRDNTQARALHRACVILGGLAPAAQHFGVPAETLRSWMEGQAEVPEPIFLQALDAILLHLENPGRAQ